MVLLSVFGDEILLRGAQARPGALFWQVDADLPLGQQIESQEHLKRMLGFGSRGGLGFGPGVELRRCGADGTKGDLVDMGRPLGMQLLDRIYVAAVDPTTLPSRPRGRLAGRIHPVPHNLTVRHAREVLGLFYERRERGPLYVSKVSHAAEAAGLRPGRAILSFDGKAVVTAADMAEAERQWRASVAALPASAFPRMLEIYSAEMAAPAGKGRRRPVRRAAPASPVPPPPPPPADSESSSLSSSSPDPPTPKYWPWAGSAAVPWQHDEVNITGPPNSPRCRRAAPAHVFDLPAHALRSPARSGRGAEGAGHFVDPGLLTAAAAGDGRRRYLDRGGGFRPRALPVGGHGPRPFGPRR